MNVWKQPSVGVKNNSAKHTIGGNRFQESHLQHNSKTYFVQKHLICKIITERGVVFKKSSRRMLLYITAAVFNTENQDVSEPQLTSRQNVQFEQGI